MCDSRHTFRISELISFFQDVKWLYDMKQEQKQ